MNEAMNELFNILPNLSWELVYSMFLVSLFCLASTSSIKNILLNIPKIKHYKNKELIKSSFTFVNYLIGGLLGFYMFPYTLPTKILIGCVCGWLSPIMYRLVIRLIFSRAGITIDEDLDPSTGNIKIPKEIKKLNQEFDKEEK